MTYILRRRKLGNTSCREIVNNSETGIRVIRNDAPLPQDEQLVIRWGCTSTVPQRNVLNTAAAIHGVSDKIEFRRKLNEDGLCPKTWFTLEEFRREEEYPVIVRPRHHHQGRNLFVAQNIGELQEILRKAVLQNGYYISRKINKTHEYRVFVVSGRAVAVANKIPADANAVAWNVAQGGSFENVRWDDWPLKAVKVAIEGFNLSGLDFGGVDIMVDDNNDCFILEINSAPSLTSPYRQQTFAKAFDYIVRNGKEKIGLIEARGGYKKFIHPAVCNEATLP